MSLNVRQHYKARALVWGGAIRFNSRNNSRNMEPDGEERNRSNPTLKGEIRCFSALSGCSIGLLF